LFFFLSEKELSSRGLTLFLTAALSTVLCALSS